MPRKRLKVLFIEPNQAGHIIGGSQIVHLETVKYLKEYVDIISYWYQKTVYFDKLDGNCRKALYMSTRSLEEHTIIGGMHRQYWKWLPFVSILMREKPDIVHFNRAVIYAFPWAVLKLFFRYKLVIQAHGFETIEKRVAKFILRQADGLIYVSQAVSDFIDNRRLIKRGKVIHNGVRSDILEYVDYPKDKARRELGIEPGEKALLVLGNIWDIKGQHRATAGMEKWSKVCDSCKLYLVGRITDRAYFSCVEKAGAKSGSRIAYIKEGTDKPGLWLRAADLVLNPSTSETFGLNVVEAIACGTPVVTCADGGPPEILNTLGIGTVSDKDSFIGDVARILADDRELDRLRQELKGKRDYYNFRRAADEVYDFYQSLYKQNN